MQWYAARFHVSEEASEALAEQLIQLGAFGLATQDPFELQRLVADQSTTMFLDPEFVEELPDYVEVRAFFPLDERGIRLVPCLADEENPFFALEQRLYGPIQERFCSLAELEKELQAILDHLGQFLTLGPADCSLEMVKEEDWENGWKQYYQPLSISDHIQICPSWIEAKPKPGQVQLRLDPGSAFGTGSHETTALCLQLLSHYLWEDEGPILDLGCGSGILAIAAAKLGAKQVEALDIDPGAVEVTRINALQNKVKLDIHVGSADQAHQKQYPLILANLLAEVLVHLEPELREIVEYEGHLICSGIVDTKAELLDKVFQEENWLLVEERCKNNWVARVYKRMK